MHPRTIRLHEAMIKLAKGAVRAWEEWLQSHKDSGGASPCR